MWVVGRLEIQERFYIKMDDLDGCVGKDIGIAISIHPAAPILNFGAGQGPDGTESGKFGLSNLPLKYEKRHVIFLVLTLQPVIRCGVKMVDDFLGRFMDDLQD